MGEGCKAGMARGRAEPQDDRVDVSERVARAPRLAILLVSVVVVLQSGASPAFASGGSSTIDKPFLDDPQHVVAYRPVGIDYHAAPAQRWKVYSCDTPANGPVPSAGAAVAGWGDQVAAWFAWASEGRYQPSFEAAGELVGESRRECADEAADRLNATERADRTGTIILYDDSPAGGGAYGLSATTTWSTDGNAIGIGSGAPPPRVTLSGGGVDEGWRWELVVHEMGHTMGWGHVTYEDGHTYGNFNDVMGGIQGVGTAVFNRYRAGWLDPSQVQVYFSASATYQLGAVGTDDTQMLVIPTEEVGVLYTVGARRADLFDTAASAGVEIHRVDQSLPDSTSSRCASWGGRGACLGYGTDVVAIAPPGTDAYEYGSWQVGQSVTVGGVTVEVVNQDSTGFTVDVTGSAAPMWPATAASLDPTYRPPTPAAGEVPEAPLPAGGDPIGFGDVPVDHPHAVAINWLAASGITLGCNPPDNDRFCPDASVTRGQMAAFLARAGGLSSASSSPFVDVSRSVFDRDISAIALAKITRGCNPPDNDRFCPDASVTRGQMAGFLVRAFDLDGGVKVDYALSDTVGHIFEADISRLVSAGVSKGCNPPTNDRFCPGRSLSRAEMAAFLHRILG